MAHAVQEHGPKVRLDIPALKKRLGRLGLEMSIYRADRKELDGPAGCGAFCQQMSRAGGHCESFLSKLASESLSSPKVRMVFRPFNPNLLFEWFPSENGRSGMPCGISFILVSDTP